MSPTSNFSIARISPCIINKNLLGDILNNSLLLFFVAALMIKVRQQVRPMCDVALHPLTLLLFLNKPVRL